ncbi:putative Prolamin-like domain-containing protein [Rosa chinensis]|uniref:Putative Prolamin-like domain-containing protein n=1 Tax=Rosa chinensis TaxID=74649 RepID=A0A2P6RS69_ROSCH|nr:egg cell-secreted protein 1.2 [Rosa chinensis]PRQ49241.1 putative Prolamin-like domain-containing protein [Rosa chinensis]
MALKNLVFLSMVTLIASLIMSASNATATRKISAGIKTSGEGEGGLVECGNALEELKSCSQEIVVYFLNGKANIGPDCCKAIATITRHCWPAMLTSLGFTAEQGDILRGYCDAAAAVTTTAPAAAPLARTTPLTSC